jgi:hypothetical protein
MDGDTITGLWDTETIAGPPDWIAAVRGRVGEVCEALGLPEPAAVEATQSNAALMAFTLRYGQSFDYILGGNPAGMVRRLQQLECGERPRWIPTLRVIDGGRE